jgi:hypothetical protein
MGSEVVEDMAEVAAATLVAELAAADSREVTAEAWVVSAVGLAGSGVASAVSEAATEEFTAVVIMAATLTGARDSI